MDQHFAVQHLAFVSVVSAVMLLSGARSADVNGIIGSNITLKFTFENINYNFSHFGVYYGEDEKLAECKFTNCSSGFVRDLVNGSIFYHITNLSHQHNKVYYASLLNADGLIPKSNSVRLMVTEDNRTSTVPPSPTPSSAASVAPRGLSSSVVTGLALCPVLLLATALLCVSWYLLRTRDANGQTQDTSVSTVQATVAASQSQLPASSLVYSVLDFPLRRSTVLDIDNDTTYATINY